MGFVCAAWTEVIPDRVGAGTEAPTPREDLLCGARQNLGRIRLRGLLRVGCRQLAELDGLEGLLQRLRELLATQHHREPLRVGERVGVALEEAVAGELVLERHAIGGARG